MPPSRVTPRSTPFYTWREEIANAVTHGIGAVLSVVGAVTLIVLAALHGDWWRLLSVTVYGVSMALLYTASTLYHALQAERIKLWLRRFDHAAIYVLIAGSYTPFLLVQLRDAKGMTMLAVIWGLAVIGIVYKLFYTGRYDGLSTLLYVGMGWLAVLIFRDLWAALPRAGVLWIVAGGLSYTVGVAFYLWKRLPYNHAVWHLFVLAGSACHYIAVLRYV